MSHVVNNSNVSIRHVWHKKI